MTTTAESTSDRFAVLHALLLKGLATEEILARASGLDVEAARTEAAALCEAGLARHRSGRVTGYTLTAQGRAAHAELLPGQVDAPGAAEALAEAYAAFLRVNATFKGVCTRWQLRGERVPNDHTDEAYDGAVVAELEALHGEAGRLLGPLAEALPRFGRYRGRLGGALERLQGGERDAFVKPMAESYHDIWMELHEDLLVSGRRKRTAEDGS